MATAAAADRLSEAVAVAAAAQVAAALVDLAAGAVVLAEAARVPVGRRMRTKDFIGRLEHDRIVRAIATAERKTSGEIRVFIQRGEIDDPVAAARAKFQELKMTATRERNAVLIFVAPRSQKFAVIGDEGIHQRCGDEFWAQLVTAIGDHFKREDFTFAIVKAIEVAGARLAEHFPRAVGDRNELPNAVEEG